MHEPPQPTFRTLEAQPAALLLAAVLLLGLPRSTARAENSIAYKYEDYREAHGRIAVQTQSGLTEADLGTETHLKFTGTIDAIVGATPTGQPAAAGSNQVDLSELHERRKAWTADLSHQFSFSNIDVGFANSRESDYISSGWSVNTLTDFNQKNTTLRAGLAESADRVEVFFKPAYLHKQTEDAILGVTQLIDAETFATFNVTWGRATGFLSDQYKIVQKTLELLPGVFLPEAFAENRPDQRNKGTALLAVNHAFKPLNGALEASYRFYRDTYGINASTVELAWFQQVGSQVILRPSVRYYDQTSANFYYYNLDNTSIIPARTPTGTGTYYTSDYRLSALQTYTYGLKAIWTPNSWLQLDVAVEKYEMRGDDGLTPQSAYPRALITTGGVKISW